MYEKFLECREPIAWNPRIRENSLHSATRIRRGVEQQSLEFVSVYSQGRIEGMDCSFEASSRCVRTGLGSIARSARRGMFGSLRSVRSVSSTSRRDWIIRNKDMTSRDHQKGHCVSLDICRVMPEFCRIAAATIIGKDMCTRTIMFPFVRKNGHTSSRRDRQNTVQSQ